MGYRLDNEQWLEDMEGMTTWGCATIPESELPLSDMLISWFDYTASDEYNHVFNVPLEDKPEDLVLYAKGTYTEGEVTILTTNITRTGFTVQAPIDCRVDFIIGYKND